MEGKHWKTLHPQFRFISFNRSNIMHYQNNNHVLNKDDLIMLDGGCLYKQYSSDITRFWPLNGN